MNDIQSLQANIDELTRRIKVLEDTKFLFPIKLGQLEKKSINNLFWISGNATIPPSGNLYIPYGNTISTNNIAFATYTDGTGVVTAIVVSTSGLYPDTNQLYITGTGTKSVYYIIFLLVDASI